MNGRELLDMLGDGDGSDLLPFLFNQTGCPDWDDHRGPEGPCEDLGQCSKCGSITFSLRPEGETIGFHAEDCSLPIRHERDCVGGGIGHPPGIIRGYWPGMDGDIENARRAYEERAANT